ncbi:MAG: MEDS domain-containing protein [Candidatus Methylomirabilis oxyfera]|nr:MEDS domain-containing protein [Candidatus Methylomirabilis oxyfera]
MNGQRLLNTKEAAKFLAVSEASVRRWADAGILPCRRIGGRRERRFTKDDLLFVLKKEKRPATASSMRQNFILIEGVEVPLGTHLCNLYSSDEGGTRLAIPFLKDGLESDQPCFVLATHEDQQGFLRALEKMGTDVKDALRRKQLIVSSGFSGAAQVLAYFEKAFAEALQSRPGYIRVVGDMTWGLRSMSSVEELMDFEMRLDLFGRRFPVVTICQYDVRQFNGSALLQVLKFHPDIFNFHLGKLLN